MSNKGIMLEEVIQKVKELSLEDKCKLLGELSELLHGGVSNILKTSTKLNGINKLQLAKILEGHDLEKPANDANGNVIPNKTNLQYIVDQCDIFKENGGVNFDYDHNGILGCISFNISTQGNNVFRPLIPSDLPLANEKGDYFTKLYDIQSHESRINVFDRAMRTKDLKVTDVIDDRIDVDSQDNKNYFKHFAKDYEIKGLTLNNKEKFNIFLDDLARDLNIPGIVGGERHFAEIAFSYIMLNITLIDGRSYRGSKKNDTIRSVLKFGKSDRGWYRGGDPDGNNGLLFAGRRYFLDI